MKSKAIFLIPILGFALLVIYLCGAFYLLHSNDLHNREIIRGRESWVETNKEKLMHIYTNAFPRAEECKIQAIDCELELRQLIDDNLSSTLGYANEIVGRRPIFFIKLKDDTTIEKIYQGGGYREELADTLEEKMVVEMLQGKRDPFAYPQYNCCGGNDIVPDIPILNLFLPPRIYLKDFPSEVEHIYLVRDENSKIIGALVYLYGD